MRIEILSPLVGMGHYVKDQKHVFALEAGMVAEVDDEMARKWIESGLARQAVREEERPAPTSQIATVAPPETAMRKQPVARKGRRSP